MGLFDYALILPGGRDPLYLPGTTKPQGAGYSRNITLRQPPGTESGFTTGDGTRKLGPLVLLGSIDEDDLPEPTEDAARLYVARLDAAAPLAIGAQRGQSVTRALLQGGFFEWVAGDTPLIWTYTLNLFPSGPDWIDQSTGRPVPF
ncbi:hypothetical protein [uncultured Deinococcus sp.]|uniref:hypothetical protein n=1 Tax=uncultured Deinococcus sp. TaxID=158789 RepID=UPI00258C796D|nr:hypothetical protein [uncultured Deinococcus sp.]